MGAASVVVTGAVTAGTLNIAPHRAVAPDAGEVAAPSATGSQGSGAVATPQTPPTQHAVPAGAAGGGAASTISSTTTTVPSGGGGSAGGGGGDAGGGGSGKTTITVPPVTAPMAPSGVGAMAGNGQATISWTAPANGGSAITSYTVTSSVGGVAQGTSTFASSATVQVVTGLTNGTTYTFSVVATNYVGSSPPSIPSPAVTPTGPSLTLVSGGKNLGRAKVGDQIIVVFSPAPSPDAMCSAWSATSSPDLVDHNVVVEGNEPAAGDDTMTVSDTADCSGGFHFGTIDLGQRGYFTKSATFGGRVTGCGASMTTACSIIHWDGYDTLTITLGKPSAVQPTQTATSVAVYTPDPTLGLPGPISSVKEENF